MTVVRKNSRDLFPFLILRICYVAIFLAGSPYAYSDTLRVCEPCDYASISGAIEKANPGDIIRVEPGEYSEGTIKVDKRLTLTGVDYPVINGNGSADVFLIEADSVVISGFLIRNTGISYIYDLAAIKVNDHDYCRIENNRLVNTFFGIYLKHAHHCQVLNNEINGNAIDEVSSGNAIHIWYSGNIDVIGNVCRNHRDGIYFEFVDNSMLKDNLSEGNLRYGLHFMFSNHDLYLKNTFRDNGAGVAVMFSRFITMNDNLFEHNWGPSSYGLLLKDILDGEISGNTFLENTIGIYADGSNRIQIRNNDFKQNGWALKILGSCMNDTISRNNFEANTFDVITNTSTNHNYYNGNYWSEYTGYDLNKDRVGDIPYKPVKLFSVVSGNVPASIILLRSFFVELLNFSEKVVPSITPKNLEDAEPLMKRITR